ncbi:MAG: hypothetical protein NC305_09485 [Lachnospiraceae bacterium]|nr:hypothetical protein [Butyrivibrio sp.]MCM1343034.1 hypothetical protein [Muribaculaceae bacterium]MCM1410765.1 hypothetical protein [Lachnospiraceae bacterium]
MTFKVVICIAIVALFSLAGYYYVSFPMQAEREDTWSDQGFLKVGNHLTIQNADNRLMLLDSKDVLSANGLYYAAWTMGGSEPYVNSEGATVDLYDAQLYLVLGEHKNEEEARKDVVKWLDAARGNYEILTEEEITCNGQSYSLLTYNCVSESNPYERGVSAFGVYDDTSVCMELTCREGFEEDPGSILIPFLERCSYEP